PGDAVLHLRVGVAELLGRRDAADRCHGLRIERAGETSRSKAGKKQQAARGLVTVDYRLVPVALDGYPAGSTSSTFFRFALLTLNATTPSTTSTMATTITSCSSCASLRTRSH